MKLDADLPHITLRKHPWRSLKTASSERDIPLVESAYDAARKVIEQDQKFAFPQDTVMRPSAVLTQPPLLHFTREKLMSSISRGLI